MPIKVPADAKVVRDQRLSLIRVVKILAGRIKPTIDKVKADLKLKKAKFAESDLAIAVLRGADDVEVEPEPIEFVDPKKLWALAGKGALTANDFFSVTHVNESKLSKLLLPQQIEAIKSSFTPTRGEDDDAAGALFVETKPTLAISEEALKRIEEIICQEAGKAAAKGSTKRAA